MNSNTFYQMRAIIIIMAISCCLFSSCEEDKDPFADSWEYRPSGMVNPKTDTLVLKFELHQQGNSYQASEIKVNSQRWSYFAVENVTLEHKIGIMSFGSGMPVGNGVYEEIIMYNCVSTRDHISVDSVLVLYGNPRKKSVYKSQFIIQGLL